MPCKDAMITNVVTIGPNETVADALAKFDDHAIRCLPVIDEKNQLLGLLNFQTVLQNILPIPVTLDGGIARLKHLDLSLDHIVGVTPWVAKRLGILMPKRVSDVMVKKPVTVKAETPLREGVRLLVKNGSPVPVVAEDGTTLVGIISSQAAVSTLVKIHKDMEAGKVVHE